MAGFQQLRVTRKVDFRGAVKVGLGYPITKGKVLYVDSRSWGVGASGRDGLDPDYPLNTMANAYALCTAGNGDYIFLLDGYDNDTATLTIAKTNLHIIGLGSKSHSAPYVWLLTNGDGSAAVFTLKGGDAANCEIAGFTLGGDASHPCITSAAGTSTNLVYGWIHDCAFASTNDTAFVAQDGIAPASGGNIDGTLIEDCTFGDQLTRDGIRFIDMYGGLIRNNIFRLYGGVGVHQITGGHSTGMPDVIGNKFYQSSSGAEGCAITTTDAGGGMMDDNHAMEDTANPGNNPYQEGTGSNAWGLNYSGDAVTYPA